MSKFRYLIIDEDGIPTGTNDEVFAIETSHVETFYVVDMEAGHIIYNGHRSELLECKSQ